MSDDFLPHRCFVLGVLAGFFLLAALWMLQQGRWGLALISIAAALVVSMVAWLTLRLDWPPPRFGDWPYG